MKKVIYGLTIVLTVLLVQQAFVKVVPEKSVDASTIAKNSIEKVFEKYSVHERKCYIEGYYYIGNMYCDENKSVEILDGIASNLGVKADYEYERNSTDNEIISKLRKEGINSNLLIQLITTEQEISENVLCHNNFISINLYIKNSLESGYYYRNSKQFI